MEINDELEAKQIAQQYLGSDDPYVLKNHLDYLNDFPRRIYKAVPEKIWMNDKGSINGNYIDIRTELK